MTESTTLIKAMPKISPEEKRFLDKNGYLILKQIINPNQIESVSQKIAELQKEEGLRVGDVRTSEWRKELRKQATFKSKFKLFVFDSTFKLLRKTLSYFRRNHAFNEMLYMYSIRPNIYADGPKSYRNELKLMVINIVQQAEQKVERVCNLANKGKEFDVFYSHPKVMSVVSYLLGKGNFKLSSLNYRNPKKGCLPQPLHIDFPWSVKQDECFSSNTLWLLNDMTLENGPTRFVPGTHKREDLPCEDIKDVIFDAHPDEIIITAKAGDVIILNGHVWHGGTTNTSGNSRKLIQSFFTHKAHHSQQFQRNLITKETKERLNQEALEVLDY